MIIKLIHRSGNNCRIVAFTSEHVYNAWMRDNTLHFYVLSNSDIINYFTACIENGEIRAVIDDVAITLYSHDELINTVKCAFSDYWHDAITILETMLYVE